MGASVLALMEEALVGNFWLQVPHDIGVLLACRPLLRVLTLSARTISALRWTLSSIFGKHMAGIPHGSSCRAS